VTILLHLLIVLVVAPLVPGVINRTKAIVAGRRGQPLLQAYYDIVRLLRRGTLLSETTTPIFLIGPAVALGGALIASLMLPLGSSAAPVAFAGDVIVFVYIFALSRFFTTSAALDTGSPFEGMGAAREVTFAVLTEPALLLGMLALARLTHSLSLSGLLDINWAVRRTSSAALVLVVASWLIVLLAENSRVPFDDPNTHLELTMIHEVMVLDHSGPAFGLILYASAVKLFVFSALVTAVIVPRVESAAAGAALTIAGVLILGVGIGIVESSMARLRLVRIPQLLVTAMLVSAFAVVLVLK
jgi:formate hydrogenlyase subunit 4